MNNLNKQKKGHFISIDGTDGSGKQTQTKILVDRLSGLGFDVKTIEFPQYGQKSSGMIEEYLNGKYGTPSQTNPYIGSLFYANDRYDASFKIKKWLDEGKIVITDRYVSANMGHQGGKIDNPLERKKYFDWLYDLEYNIFKIPKPDLNIILHVDAKIAQNLITKKEERTYIKNENKDIHENDLSHLRDAEKVYLEISSMFSDFSLIECSPDNKLFSINEISELIWQNVLKLIYPYDDIPESFKKSFSDLENYSPDFNSIHQKTTNPQNNILKVERLNQNAKLPTRSHKNDAGLDLYSSEHLTIYPSERALVKTGLKIAIPESHVGLIWDKSGIAKVGIQTMAGVIDSGYRGEIKIIVTNSGHDVFHIEQGQEIAQMLIQKIELPKIVETSLDNKTDRGTNGFGSTGLY